MWEDQSSTPAAAAAEGKTATLIYVLYLAGLIIGITPLIGLVMAYVYRDGAPYWARTHYHFQIRTFWIGLLYIVIGALTSWLYVGIPILIFWVVWYILRCVKGLKLVSDGLAQPNPLTWWW
jgi:uncharacterized membrane protein